MKKLILEKIAIRLLPGDIVYLCVKPCNSPVEKYDFKSNVIDRVNMFCIFSELTIKTP